MLKEIGSRAVGRKTAVAKEIVSVQFPPFFASSLFGSLTYYKLEKLVTIMS